MVEDYTGDHSTNAAAHARMVATYRVFVEAYTADVNITTAAGECAREKGS